LNLVVIASALNTYERTHRDEYPETLAALTEGEHPLLAPKYLLNPAYRPVEGSLPPTSYVYVPPKGQLNPDALMVFPNGKLGSVFKPGLPRIAVIDQYCAVRYLTIDEFWRRLVITGIKYDALPEVLDARTAR
jgi:hypothetical protein